MRFKLVASVLAASTLALAACGDDSDDTATDSGDGAGESSETPTETDDTGGGEIDSDVVQLVDTELGEVLADAEGLTLYGFTDDTDGTPTCEDACADAWPPLTLESEDLPEGLDANVFSVVERSDGTPQLAAGGQPLYTFAEDAASGDLNGQGFGDKWYVVSPSGEMVQDAIPETDAGSTEPDGDDGY